MNAIVDALRARYRTPREALIALDLDPDLLNKPYRVRDEDRAEKFLEPLRPKRDVPAETLRGKPEEIAEDDPAEELLAILSKLNASPAQKERIGEILLELANAVDDEDEAEEEAETERPDALKHEDAYEDEPTEDEDDPWTKLKASRMPQAGKPRQINGARIGAMDASPSARLLAMIPNLARLGVSAVDHSVVPLAHDGRIQNMEPRKSSAGSPSFYDRFPALKRVA